MGLIMMTKPTVVDQLYCITCREPMHSAPFVTLTDWNEYEACSIDPPVKPQAVTRQDVEAFLADPWMHLSPHDLARAYLELLASSQLIQQQQRKMLRNMRTDRNYWANEARAQSRMVDQLLAQVNQGPVIGYIVNGGEDHKLVMSPADVTVIRERPTT